MENEKEWYYEEGGLAVGPFDPDEIQELRRKGAIEDGTLVCKAGSDEWLPLVTAIPRSEGRQAFTSDVSSGHPRIASPNRKLAWLFAWAFLFLLTIAGVWVTKRNTALARVPNRSRFEKMLAGVTMDPPNDSGQVCIHDASGQALIVSLDLAPQSDPGSDPVMPEDVRIKLHFDEVPNFEKTDDEINQVQSGAEFYLESVPLAALKRSVDIFADWSIAAAENHTGAVHRKIEDDGTDAFWFSCKPDKGNYSLSWYEDTGADIEEINRGRPALIIYPITSYRRLHLWKYFCDHLDEIQNTAQRYLVRAKESEASKIRSLQQARAAKAEKRRQEESIKAEGERSMDRIFQRPH